MTLYGTCGTSAAPTVCAAGGNQGCLNVQSVVGTNIPAPPSGVNLDQ